jgi:hypothetical protein
MDIDTTGSEGFNLGFAAGRTKASETILAEVTRALHEEMTKWKTDGHTLFALRRLARSLGLKESPDGD